MTRASKLYPSKIQAQCNEAITLLEESNNCLRNIQSCISEFVNDTMIESIAFDQLKMQCKNYIGVIDSITNINNSDISDYGKLSSEVGSEVLEGEIIITNQEKFMRLRDEAYENEREYRSKASNCWYAPLAVIYSGMAEMFRLMGDNYQEEYQVWVEKEMLYDSIEAATSGLFANSGAVRGALGSLLSELQGSFKLYFGYTPDKVALENMQLKYIEQGDIDTANGIKALNEYLIQTGKFTAAERNAIINNISECAPEKLRSLPHIISAAGTAAGIANMKALIKKYESMEISFDEELYKNNKFYRITADYINKIASTYEGEQLDSVLEAYKSNYDVYASISLSANVPPELIAAIHYREGEKDFFNGTFNVYLQNGQTLGKETTIVPKGIYYDNFKDAAVATFQEDYINDKADKLGLTSDSKDLTAMVTLSVLHNGWAQKNNGLTSYGYAGTDIYTGGFYISDGVYDESVKDERLGTYVIIKYLLENM